MENVIVEPLEVTPAAAETKISDVVMIEEDEKDQSQISRFAEEGASVIDHSKIGTLQNEGVLHEILVSLLCNVRRSWR